MSTVSVRAWLTLIPRAQVNTGLETSSSHITLVYIITEFTVTFRTFRTFLGRNLNGQKSSVVNIKIFLGLGKPTVNKMCSVVTRKI